MRRHASFLPTAVMLAATLLAAAPATAADEASRLHLRGLLDLVLHNDNHAVELARFDPESSPLESQRLRLFAEGSASASVDVFTQVVISQNEFWLDGAYALITPWHERDLHLMAGKVPALVGVWAPRTYSNKNPLVTSPLLYQHHTSLRWDDTPPSAEALLAAAGRGWNGADYGFGAGAPGMPIVDDYGWDFGVAVIGSRAPFEFTLGVTNSAPGWASPGEDVNDGKAVQGRIGLVPTAGVRVGVSAAHGAYLGDWVRWSLPEGRTEADYAQDLLMTDLAFERGRLELHGEGCLNAFDTPYCGVLRSTGGYVEGRWGFDNGLWLAVRGEALRFSDLTAGTVTRPWDDDVDRTESGLGYRLARGAAVKAAWQRTRLHEAGGVQTHDLFMTQLSLEF
ncbi:MAG: hypothetical protein U0704_13605 [Candidatus Eisenbacteria bacterium]